MCWSYTLIYTCWDCIVTGRSAEACVVVEPGAEDPVRGGYNHEGWLCPTRYLGQSPNSQSIAPMDCPALREASNFSRLLRTNIANTAILRIFSPTGRNGEDFLYSPPEYRFWVCPIRRHRYLALGPLY